MVAKDAAIADYMRRAFEAQGHQVEMIGADEMLERMERASVTPALGGIFSKPIKILEDDGRIIASLTIEDEKERPA